MVLNADHKVTPLHAAPLRTMLPHAAKGEMEKTHTCQMALRLRYGAPRK